MKDTDAKKTVLMLRPVDGGRAVIGAIDCPHCGKEHLTTQIGTGLLRVFCGDDWAPPSGWASVDVQEII